MDGAETIVPDETVIQSNRQPAEFCAALPAKLRDEARAMDTRVPIQVLARKRGREQVPSRWHGCCEGLRAKGRNWRSKLDIRRLIRRDPGCLPTRHRQETGRRGRRREGK